MKYDFDRSIGRLTPIVSRKLGKAIMQRFHEKDIQITSDEWTILAYLARFKVQNQNELADVLGKDKVAITRYISGLEMMGYIMRETNEDDKRANQVMLTEQGMDLYRDLIKNVEEVLESAYRNISKDDLNIAVTVMQKIIENT